MLLHLSQLFRRISVFLVFIHQLLGCSINLRTNSPTNRPLIISSKNNIQLDNLPFKSNIFQSINKNWTTRLLNLPDDEEFTIVCPGAKNVLQATGKQLNTAKCHSDKELKLNKSLFKNKEDKNNIIQFKNLGCSNPIRETIKESGACADDDGIESEIGWKITKDLFINQISICHQKDGTSTFYSVHQILGASINAKDINKSGKRGFRKSHFFKQIKINNAYQNQEEAMVSIFGDELAAKYLDRSKSFFFVPGQFSPAVNFNGAVSRHATYYYINSGPQWESINSGNWRTLEKSSSILASRLNRTLTVFTGQYGQLTLDDSDDTGQLIHLAKDENDVGMLSVPKYFWKVVHDPETNQATAFVSINNPHLNDVADEDIFCKDVCDQVSWVSWNMDLTKGFMFCCSVSDLKDNIPYAPDLGDLDGLLV